MWKGILSCWRRLKRNLWRDDSYCRTTSLTSNFKSSAFQLVMRWVLYLFHSLSRKLTFQSTINLHFESLYSKNWANILHSLTANCCLWARSVRGRIKLQSPHPITLYWERYGHDCIVNYIYVKSPTVCTSPFDAIDFTLCKYICDNHANLCNGENDRLYIFSELPHPIRKDLSSYNSSDLCYWWWIA